MIEQLNIQMVDLKGQYNKIKDEIQTGFDEVINACAFVNGPPVKQFAKNLEHYLDVKHVIPCGNGTDALQIALMALDLQPGDEVITVPFSFVATAEVIALLGLKPVFVDVEMDSFNMDVSKLETAITDKTKAIIPVHLFGQMSNMEALMEIANRHQITVIEDNAQAIGSDFYFSDGRTQKAGTIGYIGCTSFYPSKNLGCYGDGGAMFTNDDDLAHKIRCIANHGQVQKYRSDFVGVNSRLDSFQAVILDAKLKHLDEYVVARNKAAVFYDNAFKDQESLTVPHRVSYSNHVFHQYTLNYKGDRDGLKTALKEAGIPTMVYYPVPMHLHKAYDYLGNKVGDFPVCEYLAEHVISLPMHTEFTEDQLNYIVEQVLSKA